MTGQPPLYIEDILAALRERRIGNETASRWIEMRLADRSRQVRAHATPGMVDRVTNAVRQAMTGGDEFSSLFPPHDPLGPGDGAVEYPNQPLIYDAPDKQGNRQVRQGFASPRFPRSMPYASADSRLGGFTTRINRGETPAPRDVEVIYPAQAAAAAPLSDDELYDALFPSDYRSASGWDAG